MKKCNLLLNFVGFTLITIPLFLSTSSCSIVEHGYFRELDFNGVKPKSVVDLKIPNFSIEKILNGTKKYHNGNYALIFGCEAIKYSNLFFTGPSSGKYHDYFDSTQFSNGVLSKNFDELKNYHSQVDFGILCVFDFIKEENVKNLPTTNNYHGDRGVPYSQVWTSEDEEFVNKEPIKSLHPNWKDIVKKDKFIREDSSAINMRSVIEHIKTLFSSDIFKLSNSSSADEANFPYAMVWKDGIPQKSYFSTYKNYDDLVNKLIINLWLEKK